MSFQKQLVMLIIAGPFLYGSVHCFLFQRSPRQHFHSCFHDQQPIAISMNNRNKIVDIKGFQRLDNSGLYMDLGKFLSDAFGMGNNDDDKEEKDNKKSTSKSNKDLNIYGQDDAMHEEGEYGYVGCSNIFKIKGMDGSIAMLFFS
jgi:hypothetical protein